MLRLYVWSFVNPSELRNARALYKTLFHEIFKRIEVQKCSTWNLLITQ